MSADVCFQKANFQESLHILNDISELVKMVKEEKDAQFFPAKLLYQKAKSLQRKFFLETKKGRKLVKKYISKRN